MKKQPKAICYNPEWRPDGTRDRLRWVENASRGLRVLGPVHEMREIVRRWDHTGWHLDPLGDGETVHGVVIALPGRDGNARFVPAVSDAFNDDCYVVDFHDVHEAPGGDTDDAKRDCMYAADALARDYAEREREFQTVETARIRIDEARERIANERKEAHALAWEMRAYANWKNIAAPAICKELHRAMAAHRATVRAAIKEIRRLTDDPYSWLEGAWR